MKFLRRTRGTWFSAALARKESGFFGGNFSSFVTTRAYMPHKGGDRVPAFRLPSKICPANHPSWSSKRAPATPPVPVFPPMLQPVPVGVPELPPVRTENLHRRLNLQASRLADILCKRELRHVSQRLSLAYDRKQIILERSELEDKLPGQYDDVYDFADRPLEVRWKGHSLPYRVFSKD